MLGMLGVRRGGARCVMRVLATVNRIALLSLRGIDARRHCMLAKRHHRSHHPLERKPQDDEQGHESAKHMRTSLLFQAALRQSKTVKAPPQAAGLFTQRWSSSSSAASCIECGPGNNLTIQPARRVARKERQRPSPSTGRYLTTTWPDSACRSLLLARHGALPQFDADRHRLTGPKYLELHPGARAQGRSFGH